MLLKPKDKALATDLLLTGNGSPMGTGPRCCYSRSETWFLPSGLGNFVSVPEPKSSQLPESWGHALLVVAHPDDEVLGLGGHLAGLQPGVFHITTGARQGENEAVARQRSSELASALDLAGIGLGSRYSSAVPDQGAADFLLPLYEALLAAIRDFRPRCLITHPYEGGHPDHDTAALVCSLVAEVADRLPIYEFTSYHNGSPESESATWKTGSFLPPLEGVIRIPLSERQRRAKEELLSVFTSQQDVLRRFSIDCELFRQAPSYRFDEPPHAGQLLYETFDWNVTHHSWRERTASAVRTIHKLEGTAK